MTGMRFFDFGRDVVTSRALCVTGGLLHSVVASSALRLCEGLVR